MTDLWVLFLIGGIILGFLAREGYRDYQEHRELMREIKRREALVWSQITAATICAVNLGLIVLANKVANPPTTQVIRTRRQR